MVQTYSDILASDSLSGSRAIILARDEALHSNWSGTVYPTADLLIGQTCYRIDTEKLFLLRSTGPSVWVELVDVAETYLSQEDGDIRYLNEASNLSDLDNAATARTNLALGTGNSPQFSAVNIGHASDTTIGRTSAGVLNVEGKVVATLSADQTWTGSQRVTPLIDNDGSFDMNARNDFLWTPTDTDTLQFTNKIQGQRGLIHLINPTPRTILLGAEVKADENAASTLSEAGNYDISYWCYDGTNVSISYSAALV